MCRHVSIWGFQNRVCLSVCLSICLETEKRNHPGFLNINPTVVIDTSMERSSRVIHHGKLETQKFDFFFKKVRILTYDEELKSHSLRQYQSYIGNWYTIGKVFTSSYYSMETQKFDFFQKSLKFEFWLVLTSWNHLSFVNISLTLVIETSMERSHNSYCDVAKARKNTSVRRHFPKLYMGSVAVHFRCSLSTMEATSLYLLPPNKFY